MANALETAIEAVNETLTPHTPENQQLIAAKVRALMVGYDKRWLHAGYSSLGVERVITAPLYNPETERRSRNFNIGGKLDVIAEYGGRRILIDHKTTSQDIQDPAAPYWRQLAIEGQVDHYLWAMWLNGEKCDGAVWDVIRKPTISPKKLTKAEIKSVVSLGKYFDADVSEDDKQWFIHGGERETVAMYEARLANDCTKERPQWYFQRQPVPRTNDELLMYSRELWQHGQDIHSSRKTVDETGHLPPRNSGACMLYNSPCKFLGICSGYDTPESDKWKVKENVHVELPQIEGDGRDLLTNSRIRCYQTCKRKHWYQYEAGIERQDEEEREALFFGSLMHLGLEYWWNCFKKGSDE